MSTSVGMSDDGSNEGDRRRDPGNEPAKGAPRASRMERAKRRRERIGWWFKLFFQPLLAVGVLVLLVAGLGLVQRLGWLTTREPASQELVVAGEEALYICPMFCVPATAEPGQCPVCGMELQAQEVTGDSKDTYGLTLDQASIRVANIRTAIAEARPLVQKIRAIGEISYDEGALATISSFVNGRIEQLFADYMGVKVDEGDELALLYSPDLYSSQVALLESRKLLRQSSPSNQRIGSANTRLYESSRQRLLELGLTGLQVDELERLGQADSRIRITSPIGGTVIDKMVEEGQYVKEGEPIFKVADLSTVWLKLKLYPKDAAQIRYGQKVVTKIQSLPGREFVGRVAFIDPAVDSKTQTVSIRVVIRNEQGLIRIGDFATALITVNTHSPANGTEVVYDPDLVGKWISPRHPHVIREEPGQCPECGMELVPASEFGFASTPLQLADDVVVPRDAVLMAGDHSVVYVETEPGRFEYRNVEIGQIVGAEVSIVSGVEAGESVVASATLLVDSQFNMADKPSLIDPSNTSPRGPGGIDPFNSPEIIAALEGLSEDQRDEVKRQRICPVTEMALGSMGEPIPVDVAGRRIWICCSGCEEKLRGDPDEYFAVLDEDRSKQTLGDTMELPQIQPLDGSELPQMTLPAISELNDAAETEDADSKAIQEALASLTKKERELARRQGICPVAEIPLGSMGTPIKLDVGGQPVFICCEACRDRLLRNPDEYLAKLPGDGDRR